MKAIKLKTIGLVNPIGIDEKKITVSWNCKEGITQTAYEIEAKGDLGTKFKSGKVESDSMTGIVLDIKPVSRERITWKVRLYDENSEAGKWSEKAFFEWGLLENRDWKAQWITGDYKAKCRKNELRDGFLGVGRVYRYPVDCFKKEFEAKKVEKARLYITACGLYEAHINGARVGDFVMAPGYTDYNKRIQYQTYDVTDMVLEGNNTLTVDLADGWYRGSVGAWGVLSWYGTQTKFIAQLEMTFEDGSTECVITDDSFKWSNDGPIEFADNKDGERVDARKTPSYGGKARVAIHDVVPSASNNVKVCEHETFKPAELITTPSGKKVIKFPQNIAGFISFKINAHEGQYIRLRCGEILDKDGEFTQLNIQNCRKGKDGEKIAASTLQEIGYTCREGLNEFKNTFSVFGFQLVLVETDVEWDLNDFTAIAVYSDIERTGYFESSNELLNKLVENTVWSQKNNFLDIPTDCPTRERHGWTGDIQIFYKTAQYLMDCAPFIKKYLKDVYDLQYKNGNLPQIAPYGGTDFYMKTMDGSVGWADVGVLIPYRMWKLCGDRSVIEDYYEKMKAYANFMISRVGKGTNDKKTMAGLSETGKKYAVNKGQSYGEWAEPEDVHAMDFMEMSKPHPEVSTAYTSYVLGIMAEIATELGHKDDARGFKAYSENCKKAYQNMRTLPQFTLDTARQAELVRPLYMNLLDAEQTEYAKKRLVKALEDYNWRLGTGFLSTPLILYVLSDMDIELAYKLLKNEEMPGWLFMPKMGATTIWESWEGEFGQGGIASMNHYSKGACVEWLFTTMCGINVEGKNHFVIAPKPGGEFDHAKASYDSVFGKVESGWKMKNGKYEFHIVIPSNCTATVSLPDGTVREVKAGEFDY